MELAPQPKGNGDGELAGKEQPEIVVELAPQPKGNGDSSSVGSCQNQRSKWSLLRSRKAMVTIL